MKIKKTTLNLRAAAAVAFPFAIAAASLSPREAHAYGESVSGFPSWAERVMHQWSNRARADPQLEMSKCGQNCGEAACYSPVGPLYWDEKLNRAARFHSANMASIGFFAHDSKCTLVKNIGSLYPDSCAGDASCACEGGQPQCSGSCTSFFDRVALFGASPAGEIIASPSDPDQAFYLWLYEPAASKDCGFTLQNGHRFLILTSGPSVGYGTVQASVGDFGGSGGSHKIPSGSHYPQQAGEVEAWASWLDGAGPSLAMINVDGACSPMSLGRGKAEDGSYKATVSNVGAGCHRYYFVFKDATGQKVTYPETGSLGIGGADCADWDPTRPAEGAGCDCAPSCSGVQCGDDGCGGMCGMCGAGETCQGGMCVPGDGPSGGAGGGGGPTGGGGAGGSGGDNIDPDDTEGDEGGCACRTAGGPDEPSALSIIALLGLAGAAATRRRGRARE
jgi:MYXO-CTERM domain-containing protein